MKGTGKSGGRGKNPYAKSGTAKAPAKAPAKTGKPVVKAATGGLMTAMASRMSPKARQAIGGLRTAMTSRMSPQGREAMGRIKTAMNTPAAQQMRQQFGQAMAKTPIGAGMARIAEKIRGDENK
jgi:hypothetical protein